MKPKIMVLALLFILPCVLSAYTAQEILAALDSSVNFRTERFSARMTVQKGARKSVKLFNGYGQSEGNQFFIEFTNPEDRGVKYLRKDKDLWIYLPQAQDSLKISGHMLRQGMMGSDLSYEDMLSGEDLKASYTAEIIGSTNYSGINCVLLQMTAKSDKVTYYREISVVDTARMVRLRIDLFAKSGRLIKRMVQDDIRQVGGRSMPMKMTIEDMTRTNSLTTLEFLSLEYNVPLPSDPFSMKVLSR